MFLDIFAGGYNGRGRRIAKTTEKNGRFCISAKSWFSKSRCITARFISARPAPLQNLMFFGGFFLRRQYAL